MGLIFTKIKNHSQLQKFASLIIPLSSCMNVSISMVWVIFLIYFLSNSVSCNNCRNIFILKIIIKTQHKKSKISAFKVSTQQQNSVICFANCHLLWKLLRHSLFTPYPLHLETCFFTGCLLEDILQEKVKNYLSF